MNKYVIFGGGILIVLLISGYVYFNSGEAPTAGPVGVFTYTTTVTKGSLNLAVSSNGVVQPINKVEVKSKASGQIEEMNFIEGQEVTKGDLLLKLDQRTTRNDVEQSKSDEAVAEANLTQAENNQRRTKELFSKGLVSEQDRDQAYLDYTRAQAQLVKAKAALSSSQERLADTRIVAPISGTVLTRDVDLGQIIASGVSSVNGGTLIATIADMNEVYVLTNVDEVDIGKVKVGQRATVVADAFPDDRFIGQVERVAPQGKTTSSVTTFTVYVLVRNRGGKLKSGMTTSVDIEIFNESDVLLIPNEALKDPRSEQGKEIMQTNNLTIPVDTTAAAKQPEQRPAAAQGGGGFGGFGGGAGFQNMTEEQRTQFREQMRQRFANMTPEERQQMASRFGGGRRRNNDQDVNEVKWRLVMAKSGDTFKPKLIKVGASNFDNSVVVDGLSEGDVVQVTTISRAKIAQEQFNDRMRSRTGIPGMGGRGR